MYPKKTAVAAGVLVLGGMLAACGGSSSSSPTAGGGGTGAPTDASQDDFCRTFTELGGSVTPHEAADRLAAVGTPSGISDSARNGFDVLVSHLSALSDDSDRADLESLAKDLPRSDQSDVIAFITYYGTECNGAPAAPSS